MPGSSSLTDLLEMAIVPRGVPGCAGGLPPLLWTTASALTSERTQN